MTGTIQRCRRIAYTLSTERNTDKMLDRINRLLIDSISARRRLIYLIEPDEQALSLVSAGGKTGRVPETIGMDDSSSEARIAAIKQAIK